MVKLIKLFLRKILVYILLKYRQLVLYICQYSLCKNIVSFVTTGSVLRHTFMCKRDAAIPDSSVSFHTEMSELYIELFDCSEYTTILLN